MLYYVAMAMAMTSAIIGGQVDKGRRADQPMYPMPCRIITTISGILAFVLLFSGFWISWYAPLVAFGLGYLFYIFWMMSPLQRMERPLAGILLGIASFVASTVIVFG